MLWGFGRLHGIEGGSAPIRPHAGFAPIRLQKLKHVPSKDCNKISLINGTILTFLILILIWSMGAHDMYLPSHQRYHAFASTSIHQGKLSVMSLLLFHFITSRIRKLSIIFSPIYVVNQPCIQLCAPNV